MKKILTLSFVILALVIALSVNVSAGSSGVTLDSAVTYAPLGTTAMVYASDNTGMATYFVYTTNGEDSQETDELSYKAPISYGINEIYVTAYDSEGGVVGVSEIIEIIGNEYKDFQTHSLLDIDTKAPNFRTNQGSAGDVSTILSEALNLSGDKDSENASHGKVAHLKSENPVNEGSSRYADLDHWSSRSAFDAPYKSGKNVMMFDFDIMPLSVDKDSRLLRTRYNGDSANSYPFIFKTDGTVQVATSVDETYVSNKITPVFDAPLGKWLNMQIVIDGVSEQVILIADGVVYSSFGFDTATTDRNKLDFAKTCANSYIMFCVETGGMGGAGKCNEFYVDNIACKSSRILKRYTFETFTSSNDVETEGLDMFPLSGAKAVLKFSEDMAEITKDDISYKVNGEETDFGFAFDADTNTVTITPIGEFLGREKCEISFSDVRTSVGALGDVEAYITFVVDNPPCAITKCETDSVVPGEYATFDVEVTNKLSDDMSGIIIIGAYKNNGFERLGTATISCPEDSVGECQVSVMIPDDYTEDSYEIFVYHVFDNSLYIIDFIEYIG